MCSALIAGGATASHAATVPGNVAPWVARASSIGAAPDVKRTTIAVHLTLQHLAELKQLVADVSTPGSPRYGRYLTPTEFATRFAPAAADVSAVQALLTNAGMQHVTVGPMGAYVTADASVAQLRTTFAVSQSMYRYGAATLRANKELPTIPEALAGKIAYIEGLDDTDALRVTHHRSATQDDLKAPTAAAAVTPASASPSETPPPPAANLPSPYCDTYIGDLRATLSTKPGPYPKTLPWLNCGYTPQQIQAAYGSDKVKFDGTGVTVAIIDAYASPTLAADGNRYAANHSLPALSASNFKQVIPAGIYNVPEADTAACSYESGWWVEQSLDLASVHGSAPGASIVYIGASDCMTSLTIALENAVYNKTADIITNSYSYNGEDDSAADVTLQDQTFMTADAEGITVLFSSGDDGDLSQLNGIATGAFESTSPYVTGVGGTSLELLNAAGVKKEYGWGTYRDYLGAATVNSGTSITTSGLETTSFDSIPYYAFAFYSGSGGGVDLAEPQPAYQASVVPSALATTLYQANGGSVALTSPRRVAPDVAMDADPYTGYLYGETFLVAGNPVSDAGCTPTTGNREYCEQAEGGTSLASPLMAGVIAIVDQARLASGKPVVGFANPMLYASRIGSTLKSAGINDVTAPTEPTAVLRGYANDLTRVRVVTINSVPLVIQPTPFPLEPCAASTGVCEGLDDVFNDVTPGYDDVTGLGVPYLPFLIKY